MDGDKVCINEIVRIETIKGSKGAHTSKGDEMRDVGDENGKVCTNKSVGEDREGETQDTDSNKFCLSAVEV